MTDFIPESITFQKSSILECLDDMASLIQFYGRENGTLTRHQFVSKYGQNVFLNCCVNGWLGLSGFCRDATSDRNASLCWITDKGIDFLHTERGLHI